MAHVGGGMHKYLVLAGFIKGREAEDPVARIDRDPGIGWQGRIDGMNGMAKGGLSMEEKWWGFVCPLFMQTDMEILCLIRCIGT